MAAEFAHLHLHTEYSLVDGTVRIPQLMASAARRGIPAVALTDYNNLFALVKFYRAAVAHGIKPIIGVDTELANLDQGQASHRVVLLCKDETGYRNLTRLITRAYLEGQQGGAPVLERDWLTRSYEGLIVLSAAQAGDVGQALAAGKPALAERYLDYWQQSFEDHYYLELQRTGREGDETHLHAAVEFAERHGIPVVATNDVRFIAQDDFEAHEVRVCIHEGRTLNDTRRQRIYSKQQYFRSAEEMQALFEDIPEALENGLEIAKRCNVSLSFEGNVLPEFEVPAGRTTAQYLRAEAQAGCEARFEDAQREASRESRQPLDRELYQKRLEHELDVIIDMGFPGYFLIVADFIRWAKENGVPVGPGRGSGAGSLVAYSLGITDLDPLHYDLLFERFLNPERVSMPDFDIDFCMEGRDRVIDYVATRYGRERVSQIITYGSMAAKAVVRDVGRVLGHPYGFVDRLAKLIPFEIGITLEKALKQEPELRQRYDGEEDVHAVIDTARSLEGLARNAGKHAGGVVIAPTNLTDFTPLYCESGGQSVVTQLDKDDVEAIGLVKFDFLGLRTLTIIDRAVRTIQNADGKASLDINDISLDDEQTYALLKRYETTAVFQLESRGIKEIIKRLQPDKFEDLVALVALYRPGPLQSGMVDDFILRKHGKAKVEYPHPDLEAILKPTYGVILYQEQVMQIAQELAGYTLGSADLLRRAMGKKKPEEMAKQRTIFLSGASDRKVDDAVANHIFDLMEKFAGYGFNKSHSAAYALLSYQTAWLKAHYPAAFMAAVLSSDMDNTDKIVILIEECRVIGLEAVPPDINRSLYMFSVVDDKTILYGLGAVKGVGQAAIDALIADREAKGPFADLGEVCRRGGVQKINKRVLEALIRAGALDKIGLNRAAQMAQLPDAMRASEQVLKSASAGQNDLFGAEPAEAVTLPALALPEWPEDQRLQGEKETLGLYLTGHPFSRFEAELSRITAGRIGSLAEGLDESSGMSKGRRQDKKVLIAGLVVAIRTRNTAAGRIAFLTLDDRSGRIDVAVFGDEYERYANLIGKDKILVIEGGLGTDDYTGDVRLRASHVMDIDQARSQYASRLELTLVNNGPVNGLTTELARVLEPYCEGQCQIQINYANARACAALRFDDNWKVVPKEDLLTRLRALEAIQSAELVYR